jgi:hypothetical protein
VFLDQIMIPSSSKLCNISIAIFFFFFSRKVGCHIHASKVGDYNVFGVKVRFSF